jgi:YhcN/YlaJ family sporulation lipoprotein
MLSKKETIKGIAILLAVTTIIVTGCANNRNNQVRQQGVQRQQAQNQPGANTETQFQIANQAADNIVKLNGVRQANVLVTRRNAYVAAVLDTDQGQLTREMEDQIAKKVRETDPNIQNVYVSTNPDFVNLANRYVTDVRQGHPVSGLFEQFNEMVQRVFPNAR